MTILGKALKAGASLMGGGKLDINETAKKITSMVDESKLTKEEMVKYNLQIADKTAEFYAATLQENTLKSKARRFAVYSIIIFFMGLVITGIVYKSQYNTDMADYIFKTIKELHIATAFISVVIYFFGSYMTTSIMDKAKKK